MKLKSMKEINLILTVNAHKMKVILIAKPLMSLKTLEKWLFIKITLTLKQLLQLIPRTFQNLEKLGLKKRL